SVVVSCGFVFMGWRGLVTMALGWCMFGFYYFFSKKLFGGITGDLAGWFLTLTETLLLLWTVVGGLL
ncbi:MAG: adenosylcobinamide-GDP ribazoletransferase, partial [Lachnospiraceae bacterium]|nr:adenosylcobinamide-GDP ribazoletransferase [Lachnospiraceae bacterium]